MFNWHAIFPMLQMEPQHSIKAPHPSPTPTAPPHPRTSTLPQPSAASVKVNAKVPSPKVKGQGSSTRPEATTRGAPTTSGAKPIWASTLPFLREDTHLNDLPDNLLLSYTPKTRNSQNLCIRKDLSDYKDLAAVWTMWNQATAGRVPRNGCCSLHDQGAPWASLRGLGAPWLFLDPTMVEVLGPLCQGTIETMLVLLPRAAIQSALKNSDSMDSWVLMSLFSKGEKINENCKIDILYKVLTFSSKFILSRLNELIK